MMGLRRYDEGIEFFRKSNKFCGEHHVTWYNIGICCSYVGQCDASLDAFDKSLQMKPDYQDAIRWRSRVVEKMTKESSNVSETSSTETKNESEENESDTTDQSISVIPGAPANDAAQLPESLQRLNGGSPGGMITPTSSSGNILAV